MTRKLNPVAELAALKIKAEKPDELTELNDRYIRLAAEFDNFRKRSNKQYLEIINNANEDLIRELLSVMDDFQRALESSSAEGDSNSEDLSSRSGSESSFAAGTRMIYDKMQSILRNRGVSQVDALEQKFDPNLHDAAMQMPSEKAEGTIIGVIAPGYRLNDKVIRHAKVIVASPKQ